MSRPEKAVLLDLGNVVFAIDFRRVFDSWAAAAGVPATRFYERWAMDEAYKAHEVGALSFDDYCTHLGGLFDIRLDPSDWQHGWNQIWLGPFQSVLELLPRVGEHYHLCAFSNTNETHARAFNQHYNAPLSHFETRYLSNEIQRRKPDAEAFEFVCEDMGYTPEHVTFLDDSAANIDGARSVGLQSHYVQSEAEVAAVLMSLLQAVSAE